jgi:dienelactone hydrolase
MRRVVTVLLVGLLVSACGGGGSALPEISDGSAEIEATSLSYLVDERVIVGSLSVDVYWPTAEGSWPVVVMFHGAGGSPDDLRGDAREIAARGRVVFNAAWEGLVTSAPADLINGVFACGIAFARAKAADHGGDPAHLTVFGYSAGGGMAARAALSQDNPLSTCVAAAEGPISALVLLDPELLLYPEVFDALLADDPELFYRLTPWRDLDGSDDFPVHLLSTEIELPEFGRSVVDLAWMETRHTDIDLAAAVDAGEDGFLSQQETVTWIRDALAAEGYDVSLTILPDSTHSISSWRPAARETIWDTVVHAEER